MAFNGSNPSIGNKIRDFPSVTQSNFAAQIAGDATYNPPKQHFSDNAGNPAAVTDNIILYGKTGTTDVSLFAKTESDDVIQITDDEYLGSATTKIKCESIIIGGNTASNSQNGFITAWASVNADGTTIASYNCTTSRTADPGKYRITFSGITLANANYCPVAMCSQAITNNRTISLDRNETKTTSKFDLSIISTGGSYSNEPFFVIVTGGY